MLCLVPQLLGLLYLSYETFGKHLRTATWQQRQFSDLHKNLPYDWVVSVQDFAENYRHSSQDEVSSAFFAYEQTSLFTNVSVYKCPTCEERVEESIVFITEDTQHDAHAVRKACLTLKGHLKRKGVKITKHVIFSDGCAAQFKSKRPFHLLVDAQTERCYFGPQHGKSQCDSLGGLVKTAASRFVKSGSGSIQNAKELYEFCDRELTRTTTCNGAIHKISRFFILEKIDRIDLPALKALPRTREVHHIKSVTSEKVKVRKLSCFCLPCINEDPKCSMEEFTGQWRVHQLTQTPKERKRKREDLDDEVQNDGSRIKRKYNKGHDTENSEEKAKSEAKTVDSILLAIGNVTSYDKLLSALSLVNLPELGQDMFSLSDADVDVDDMSLPLLPPEESGVPVKIGADGNCLPRCVSLIKYGTEDRHLEMRVRIIEELCKHSEYYLSSGIDKGGKSNSAKSFASFSEFYMTERRT